MENNTKDVQQNYDLIVENYAAQFRDEMDKKPFDRKMLDWLSEKVGDDGGGIICDLGCGPGQIAGYLFQRGANVCGIDLSAEMIKQARLDNPQIDFQTGDMLHLERIADNSFGGIAAFYSIVNIPLALLPQVFGEIRRVLKPRGVLLISFHIGREIIHLDEMLEKKVSLDFFLYETAEIVKLLTAANFEIEEAIERNPYAEAIEHQTRRAYIFARNGTKKWRKNNVEIKTKLWDQDDYTRYRARTSAI